MLLVDKTQPQKANTILDIYKVPTWLSGLGTWCGIEDTGSTPASGTVLSFHLCWPGCNWYFLASPTRFLQFRLFPACFTGYKLRALLQLQCITKLSASWQFLQSYGPLPAIAVVFLLRVGLVSYRKILDLILL